MIIDSDSIKEIGATLARNKTRTFLTAFGIFWGTLMLALLWSGGQGIKRLMYSTFEGYASNSAVVVPQRTTLPYKGYKKGMQWDLNDDDLLGIRHRIPELEFVSPSVHNYSTVKYRRRSTSSSQQASISGVDAAYMNVMNPIVVAGRFINDADVAKTAKVCCIGVDLASTLFPGEEPLGKTIQVGNMYYRVVGVLKSGSPIVIFGSVSRSVMIPITTARMAYNMGNRIDVLQLVVRNGYTPKEVLPKVMHVLRDNHPLHPDDDNCVWYIDVSEQFGMATKIFTGLDVLLLFVGFSSLLAGIIGVGNIMWVVVKERTKEFGIRRAIGAKPSAIMAQILAESAFLTVIAGMFAIVVSTVILYGVTMVMRQADGGLAMGKADFQLSFGSALTILALFIVLGSAAGTIPAIKAMRIKPIEALNDK